MSLKDQGENKAMGYAAMQLDALEQLIIAWRLALSRHATDELQVYRGRYGDLYQTNGKILADLTKQRNADLHARYVRLITDANTLNSQSVYALAQAGIGGYMGGVRMG